jgi:hypothetical protein
MARENGKREIDGQHGCWRDPGQRAFRWKIQMFMSLLPIATIPQNGQRKHSKCLNVLLLFPPVYSKWWEYWVCSHHVLLHCYNSNSLLLRRLTEWWLFELLPWFPRRATYGTDWQQDVDDVLYCCCPLDMQLIRNLPCVLFSFKAKLFTELSKRGVSFTSSFLC